jgi:hypothetical protein
VSTTLAALITSCRILSGDGYSDNIDRNENLNNPDLGGSVNSVNKVFFSSKTPIVTGGFVAVIADNVVLNLSQYTPDEAAGMLTLVTAPVTSLFATYYYNLFSDAIWTELLTAAVQAINMSSGQGMTIDIPLLPEGILPAVKLFANGFFLQKIASQTGLWFNQKLNEREDNRDNVAKKYADMAAKTLATAQKRLEDYYQDRILVPAFGIVEHQARTWTPPR